MGATRNRRKPTDDAWSDRMGQRVTKMIQEWRANSRGTRAESEPADEGVTHPAYELAISDDPWSKFVREWSDCSGTSMTRPRPLLGAVPDGYAFAAQDQHVLALGPPRCNKTAGPLVGAASTWLGPLISSSNKKDFLYATAMPRSRIGSIYQFSPDGKPHAPGVIPIRWSPLQDSGTWAGAQAQAEAMVGASETGTSETRDDSFWARQGEVFLAPILHAAALKGKSMRWVVRAVVGQDRDLILEAAKILEAGDDEAQLALQALDSIMKAHDSGAKSAMLNAAATLKAYTHPGALAQTEDPNFDPAEFVAGEPEVLNEDRFTRIDRGLAPHASLKSIADRLPRGSTEPSTSPATTRSSNQLSLAS